MDDVSFPYVETIYRDGGKVQGNPHYPGFKQESKVLKQGTVFRPGALALPCDIQYDRDIEVSLRDGTRIYIDVYRPAGKSIAAPAIINAGPFGKSGGFNRWAFNTMPWRMGVPQCTVSTLEKFEGLDPAYWCLHGYAIVHPDVRGSWMSEGDAHINCTLDGQDGYDLVEWVGVQPWCNGKVSYAGNSWLSQTQWFVGAEQPPHLACLAPWEGWSDLYNDDAMRGGIPMPAFQQGLLIDSSPCRGRAEDITAMCEKYPNWNSYWEDRKAKLERITVPIYIAASWTNLLHTRGTFKGWLGVSSTEKWLRVHDSHEWPDLYYPQNVEDLRKFYDFYMKGIQNDWPHTPKVRMCILNPGEQNTVNRPETDFPLPRQVHQKMYLDNLSHRLSLNGDGHERSSIQLDGSTGKVEYTFTFAKDTELTGFFSLQLWVETHDTDDMDLFAKVSKLDPEGKLLESMCIDPGYLAADPEAERQKAWALHKAGDKSVDLFFAEGSHGRLRVSHRELDQQRSTLSQPVHTHRREQKLQPGEIVPILIEMWPHGMLWRAGQQLRLTVSTHNTRPEHLPHIKPPMFNKGRVTIHTGGQYDSFLLVPLVGGESTGTS